MFCGELVGWPVPSPTIRATLRAAFVSLSVRQELQLSSDSSCGVVCRPEKPFEGKIFTTGQTCLDLPVGVSNGDPQVVWGLPLVTPWKVLVSCSLVPVHFVPHQF